LSATFKNADIVAMQIRNLRELFLRNSPLQAEFAQFFSKKNTGRGLSHGCDRTALSCSLSTHNNLPHDRLSFYNG
jgi:hypothetical protein